MLLVCCMSSVFSFPRYPYLLRTPIQAGDFASLAISSPQYPPRLTERHTHTHTHMQTHTHTRPMPPASSSSIASPHNNIQPSHDASQTTTLDAYFIRSLKCVCCAFVVFWFSFFFEGMGWTLMTWPLLVFLSFSEARERTSQYGNWGGASVFLIPQLLRLDGWRKCAGSKHQFSAQGLLSLFSFSLFVSLRFHPREIC